MKFINVIFIIASISLLFGSCKKYEDDAFLSTYTPLGRLKSKGVWVIERMVNLSSGEEFVPIYSESHFFKFEKKEYTLNGNKFSFSTDLTQYTEILKPILQPLMSNPTDSIILGNADKDEIVSNDYTFSDDKSTLQLSNFFSFGKFLSPDSYVDFQINQSLDMEFKIERLELAKMSLNYNDLLRIEFKKIPEK